MLSNVRLFLLDVVRIQHLLRLTMVWSMATAVRLLLLLMVLLLLLLLYRHLLILGLNRNLLLLVLRRLLLLLLIMAGIYSGGNPLTECHRCKQRQG